VSFTVSAAPPSKIVVEESGLTRQPLAGLFNNGVVNDWRVMALLEAMQEHSRPVKPRDLGVIGADHLRQFCEVAGVSAETFRYRRVAGETDEQIPFVVEAAFACAPDSERPRRLVLGVNFAAALSNPYRSIYTHYDGLETRLAEQRCDAEQPIVLILHLVCARVDYQDRGKSSLVLDSTIRDALGIAVAVLLEHGRSSGRQKNATIAVRSNDIGKKWSRRRSRCG
jgi:hypothetical protein